MLYPVFFCIPVICPKLVLFLTPLHFVHLFCHLSKCILLFFSCISSMLLLFPFGGNFNHWQVPRIYIYIYINQARPFFTHVSSICPKAAVSESDRKCCQCLKRVCKDHSVKTIQTKTITRNYHNTNFTHISVINCIFLSSGILRTISLSTAAREMRILKSNKSKSLSQIKKL